MDSFTAMNALRVATGCARSVDHAYSSAAAMAAILRASATSRQTFDSHTTAEADMGGPTDDGCMLAGIAHAGLDAAGWSDLQFCGGQARLCCARVGRFGDRSP